MSDERAIEIVRRHRHHVSLSPGVGEDVQKYALDVLDDVLNDLRSPVESTEAVVGWRSMDSAPRDGSEIVAFRRLDEWHVSFWFVHWSPSSLPAVAGQGHWFDSFGNVRMPTHWTPLPPAPPTESESRPTSSPSGVEEADLDELWAVAWMHSVSSGGTLEGLVKAIKEAVRAEIRAARGRAT